MAIKINSTTVIDNDRTIYNTANVGIGTTNITNTRLVGTANSLRGLYICDGMIVTDNVLSGNAYIGTAYNGMMAGPVNITGTLTIDGNFVVV
jgi:hypothetical protein